MGCCVWCCRSVWEGGEREWGRVEGGVGVGEGRGGVWGEGGCVWEGCVGGCDFAVLTDVFVVVVVVVVVVVAVCCVCVCVCVLLILSGCCCCCCCWSLLLLLLLLLLVVGCYCSVDGCYLLVGIGRYSSIPLVPSSSHSRHYCCGRGCCGKQTIWQTRRAWRKSRPEGWSAPRPQ